MTRRNPYQPGGTLLGRSYVLREADEELRRAIQENTLFPYFLAARQSGKSSVLAHARSTLRSRDLEIAIVDLSEFSPGALSSYEAFIHKFLQELTTCIGGDDHLREGLQRAEEGPSVLLESIGLVLEQVVGRLVVCIDEIDVLRQCNFKDAFMGQLRGLFNRRAGEPYLNRIQFVLAGTASTEDLITNLGQSPFNVGFDIELADLTLVDVRELLRLGWPLDTPLAEEAARLLTYWTSGSVYLCQEVLHRAYQDSVENGGIGTIPQVIEASVAKVIEESAGSVHFRNMQRLLATDLRLLQAWRAWTTGVAPDKATIGRLMIAGISRRDEPFRNRLYRSVFGYRGPLNMLASAPPGFEYDVFVSHSSRDTPEASQLAERLRRDGLRVWLDAWEIHPGDNIAAAVESGLEHSRVLVLCMSTNAFASDWAQLEAGTFRFRDPLSAERRFLPVRLDDAPVRDSLRQFRYIDWRPPVREREYPRLLEACRPAMRLLTDWDAEGRQGEPEPMQLSPGTMTYAFTPSGNLVLTGSDDDVVRLWDVETGHLRLELRGHKGSINNVAISTNHERGLSGSNDTTLRVWDLERGRCLHTLEGHGDAVRSVAIGADHALSGSSDGTIRLWDLDSGRCLRVLSGHSGSVRSVAWSADQRYVLSGSEDNKIRLWDVETGRGMRVFHGHTDFVYAAAWSPDSRRFLSGSVDQTLRLWDVESGRCLRVFEGHADVVRCVAWSPDGLHALSGSFDGTVRLWDLVTGACLRVLTGHVGEVRSVAWSADGLQAVSGDRNGRVLTWSLAEEVAERRRALAPSIAAGQVQVQYANAKVLLVGETGVGKTGLRMRLTNDKWQASDSTHGTWATQWKLEAPSADGVQREIWLWDFGGQADQRLVHQLYMEDTALAVFVFDGQRADVLDSLRQYDRDLALASGKPFTKLLAAGRVDIGGLRVDRGRLQDFANECGFTGPVFETSAKENVGCDALRQAVLDGIDWDEIPWRSSPRLFQRLKEEIFRLKDQGRVLMRFNELGDALRLQLSGEDVPFTDEELRAVIGLLAGPGIVWELAFGGWVLLQPALIDAYAQAVIRTIREDEFERGCIAEDRVLNGDLSYRSSMERLDPDEERFVLLAMHQMLVERGLCLRELTSEGPQLIFPSYYRRERPELMEYPAVLESYRFSGSLDAIYTTLVVRLHYAEPFERDGLWRDAADFKTATGKRLGIRLTRLAEGAGELEVYFDPAIATEEKIIFSKYVHEHLLQHAQDVVRLRHYVCPHCGTPVGNRDVARSRLEGWLEEVASGPPTKTARASGRRSVPTVVCVECLRPVPLWDKLEQAFTRPQMHQLVRKLQQNAASVLDFESKERALVGEVISTVALAGQSCREFAVSDHGIDMEIEFRDDAGAATGQKLYLQLKSGNSYVSQRARDGVEVLTIRNQRNARYWMDQRFPVLLVIGTPEGEVRWMDVRDGFRRASENGTRPVRQILFQGERFDVMSVRRWRDRALEGAREPIVRPTLAE